MWQLHVWCFHRLIFEESGMFTCLENVGESNKKQSSWNFFKCDTGGSLLG